MKSEKQRQEMMCGSFSTREFFINKIEITHRMTQREGNKNETSVSLSNES